MTETTEPNWARLASQAQGLLSVSTNRVANAANLSAVIYQEVPDVSWVGFYFLEGETLVLGPFQGKPACVNIGMGKGVCGTAAATGKICRVPDVDAFDGHIACDSESRSELVIPLTKSGVLLGVLDVESTRLHRFSKTDETGIAGLAKVYLDSVVRKVFSGDQVNQPAIL